MAKKKNKKSKQNKAPASSQHALTQASISDLEGELSRRRRVATALQRKRTRLLAAIEEIDRDLTAIGHHNHQGSTPTVGSQGRQPVVKRRGPRGGNSKTLLSHLEEVLNGEVLSVSDAAEAVLANGYQTTSKTFRTIVNQTLLANDIFEKVERGRYTKRSK